MYFPHSTVPYCPVNLQYQKFMVNLKTMKFDLSRLQIWYGDVLMCSTGTSELFCLTRSIIQHNMNQLQCLAIALKHAARSSITLSHLPYYRESAQHHLQKTFIARSRRVAEAEMSSISSTFFVSSTDFDEYESQ